LQSVELDIGNKVFQQIAAEKLGKYYICDASDVAEHSFQNIFFVVFVVMSGCHFVDPVYEVVYFGLWSAF